MSDFRAEDHRVPDPLDQPRAYASEQLVPDSRAVAGVVSFLSNNEREGRWSLPRLFRALAVLGNVELDLRQAEIGYGLSVIEAVAVMGNVEITIPQEIAVECDGDSLFGTFTLKYEGRANPSMASRERVIRVAGTAYAGAVTITVKSLVEDKGVLPWVKGNLGLPQ